MLDVNVFACSDVTSKSRGKERCYSRYRPFCIILLSLLLFIFGLAIGILIGKLVFDKDDDNESHMQGTSSENWGGMVRNQSGVEKPVLEAIVDMMKAENIKENLR